MIAALWLLLAGCDETRIGAERAGPRVVFERPREGQVVAGIVEVVLDIAEGVAPSSVTLRTGDDEIVGSEEHPSRRPRFELDTSAFPDGPLELVASVRFADASRSRASVAVRVDNSSPRITILSPPDRAIRYVEDVPFPFSVRTVDSTGGLARVTLWIDDRAAQTFDPVTSSELQVLVDPRELLDPTVADLRLVRLRAVATDRLGRTGEASVDVHVRSRLELRFRTGDRIESTPAVLPDGLVAVGSMDRFLYFVRPDGTLHCRQDVGELVGSTSATSDGRGVVIGTSIALRRVDRDCAIRWTHPLRAIWRAGPTVGPDGTVHAATFDGQLYALDPATGRERWRFALNGNAQAAPAVGPDGTVYVGTLSGTLHAIAAGGIERFRFAAGSEIGAQPLATADGVYFGTYGGVVFALDPNGNERWRYMAGDFVQCSPAITSTGLVAICARDGVVRALDPTSGEERWRSMQTAYTYGGVAVGPDGVIYAGGVDGRLVALDGVGRLRWRQDGEAEFVSRPIASHGRLYFGGADGFLYGMWADGNPEL
ncbi:MAG: PQQ-binding-like beta-propeller repeat protein [Myxococcota bacterium]|nr:PQQ-binding-like beta-propeller repeat protein [Myxococcota bacterium]MDW8363044.1 PQQ-binding-like beta-propeller repeat protein [Myxococcales bacterium]